MKISMKKIIASLGITGVIAVMLFGNLIYMNLRPDDPILAGWEEYEPARFEQLQERGEPLLVEVYASWCPTCLLQHKAFEGLVEEGKAPKIRAIRVDFDTNEAFRQAHNLHGTGLLILFENGKEKARAAGLVTGDKITAFLAENGVS
ncbi:thioredoxin family protein [Kordiimonas laminariae]|uniref:thioredoxin family protein n=1 Tax=Kordiimonas laminariae TaxID=2917717 RepID=UPI001FF188F6|nr:thioredoxin family protein [Kordiimonas laminariae]